MWALTDVAKSLRLTWILLPDLASFLATATPHTPIAVRVERDCSPDVTNNDSATSATPVPPWATKVQACRSRKRCFQTYCTTTATVPRQLASGIWVMIDNSGLSNVALTNGLDSPAAA